MIQKVMIIMAVYFLAGALGILVIRHRKGKERFGKQWTKYFVYLFVVSIVVGIIQLTESIGWLMLVVLSISLVELFKVYRMSAKSIDLFFINSQLLFVASSLCFLRFAFDSSREELLFVYTLVFTFDGFSQISGQLFGRRPLLPSVSPNKTWEGFIGGFLVSVFTAYLLRAELQLSFSLYYVALILFAGFVGDGLASYYKRYYGVKDYGTCIPGHGGMLDRFDSFLASGAMYQIIKQTFISPI